MKPGKPIGPSRRVTLSDVARVAGVSVMTVSNVINGKHTGVVSAETLRRVQREIERMGYRQHEIARSLRLARSSTIGMLIVTADPLIMAAPFVATMLTGVMTALGQTGYNLITETVHPERFDKAELIQRRSIEGVIAHLAGSPRERIGFQKLLKALHLPLVLIQDCQLTPLQDCFIINQDDFEGGRMLADLVLKFGARRLVYVRPSLDWPAVLERERGIRAALVRKRGASLAVVTVDDEGIDATQHALRVQFRKSDVVPDAILCSNDHLAVAALKLVQSMGLEVPNQVSITGFNNFEYRTYTTPTLTTVQSEVYKMGVEAGTQMARRLNTGKFPETEKTLPVSLVQGGSTRTHNEPRNGTRARRQRTAL